MLIFCHNVKLCKFVGYNSENVVIGARIPSASLQGDLKCGYPAHSWQPCIALSDSLRALSCLANADGTVLRLWSPSCMVAFQTCVAMQTRAFPGDGRRNA